VQIVLNYEEGGENNILHGDAASEAFLSEIVGAAPWPGQRHWNMESIYEYGARAGFWRLHRMLGALPVTVYGVATALARAPEQVAAMKAAGWEIASHGLKWIDYRDTPREQERADLLAAIKLHREVTGERPYGLYTGRTSMNSVPLAAEEGGFAYIADTYDDDLPYWREFGDRDQLIVPYTLDANDMRFATPQGFNSGDQFEAYLRDSFDVLYAEGGRMLSIGLHCRLVGRPGRAAALQRAIDYMKGHEGVWFATRLQIAEHWARVHPPVRRVRPSEMDRAGFVAAFGGIFEHSPWIAEGAFDLELGPTHDSGLGRSFGLGAGVSGGFGGPAVGRVAGAPDLAGKLAAARRLTPESTAEQAGAGLDALTDAEREAFEGLNRRYTDRFGFPFIIAVRDNTKASILAAFERRLGNDRAAEFAEACRQVERIAELRLLDKLPR
jgi:OHCU decarboxylase